MAFQLKFITAYKKLDYSDIRTFISSLPENDPSVYVSRAARDIINFQTKFSYDNIPGLIGRDQVQSSDSNGLPVMTDIQVWETKSQFESYWDNMSVEYGSTVLTFPYNITTLYCKEAKLLWFFKSYPDAAQAYILWGNDNLNTITVEFSEV